MRNAEKLKTVERWIAAHPELIEEHWIEHDGFEPESPYSYWIYIRPPFWNPWEEVHCIHEARVSDIMPRLRAIALCESPDDCNCKPILARKLKS